MTALGSTSAAAVMALLVTAALGKLVRWSSFRAELRDYGILPAAVEAPVAAAVPVLEIASALLFFVLGQRVAGVSLAIGLLCIFTGAVSIVLTTGRRNVRCACFGRSTRTISWLLPLRNVVLAAILLAGVLLAPDRLELTSVPAWLDVALVATLGWLLFEYAWLHDLRREF
jgi:hypothetical protein